VPVARDEVSHEIGRRSFRDAGLLGYHLTFAHGYRVVTVDGSELGTLESLRYERYAEFPDRIVVRRGRLRKHRFELGFELVEAVDTRSRVVRVRDGGEPIQ
jgi:hypothetical protein